MVYLYSGQCSLLIYAYIFSHFSVSEWLFVQLSQNIITSKTLKKKKTNITDAATV